MSAMQKVFTLLTVAFLFAAVHAQNVQNKVVVWGGDKACGWKSRFILPDEFLTCESFATPRGIVSVVNHNGISLAVGFLEYDDFIIVATRIENTTNQPFEFDSDLWGPAHFDTKESFYKGNKPIRAETSVPSRDIVRGITSDVILDNSADIFLASISKASKVKEIITLDSTT